LEKAYFPEEKNLNIVQENFVVVSGGASLSSGTGHCDYKQPSLLCRQIMEIDWFLNTLDIRQESHVTVSTI
jgi:hypothetical protein